MSCSEFRLLLFIAASMVISYAKSISSCSASSGFNCTLESDQLISKDNNQSIVWNIRPQNIGFNYYLQTSDNGNDLSVRGVVTWKVHPKHTIEPNLDGFRVTILENDSKTEVVQYVLTIEPNTDERIVENSTKNEVIEMRLQFNNVLQFDRKYEAKIELLPIGKQSPASALITVMSKLFDGECPKKFGLADRWAPHVSVDVLEVSSELNIKFQSAPSFLCIKSYEVIVQTKNRIVLNQTEIEIPAGQNIGNVIFSEIPRLVLITVKVRAKTSNNNECACFNCNCITDKTDYFQIPEKHVEVTITPVLSMKSAIVVHDEKSDRNILFTTSLVIFLLLAILLVICFYTKQYNPEIQRQLLLKTFRSSHSFGGFGTSQKSYKILLVCPNAVGDEYQYMQRICQGLRYSKNRVACDKFDEFSSNAEQNMLQWIYKETAAAEKIIIFHVTKTDGGIGVYDILTTFLPSNDNRLVHVNLSSKVKRDYQSETEYTFPRDESSFEKAFNVQIPSPLVISIASDENEVVNNEPMFRSSFDSCTVDDNHKTETIDSGVSSMSSHSSDINDCLSNTLHSQCQTNLNQLKLEERPLLHQSIAV